MSTSGCRPRLARAGAVAGHDLQDAVGQPGLARQRAEAQGGERRLLRGLEHDAVADRQRRPELPRRHEQREVPRHDGADDAERLAVDHRDGIP